MHKLLYVFLLVGFTAIAQPARLEMVAGAFAPVTARIADTPSDKFLDMTRNWAEEFNRRQGSSYDISGVTENSVTVSAYKKNAFFYRNKGEPFDFRIRYDMKIDFTRTEYTVTFTVKEIYGKNDEVIQSTIGDYYTSDGSLKEGFADVEKSLEATVNNIVTSHYNFIKNFR